MNKLNFVILLNYSKRKTYQEKILKKQKMIYLKDYAEIFKSFREKYFPEDMEL